jgi:hypothetical protein
VVSNNGGEGVLTSVTTTIMIELKKDTLIKVRESTIFNGDRIKFSAYKTSMGLAV